MLFSIAHICPKMGKGRVFYVKLYFKSNHPFPCLNKNDDVALHLNYDFTMITIVFAINPNLFHRLQT